MEWFNRLGLSLISLKYKSFLNSFFENEDVKHYMQTYQKTKMDIISQHFSDFPFLVSFEKEPDIRKIKAISRHLVNTERQPFEPSATFYYLIQYGAFNFEGNLASNSYSINQDKIIHNTNAHSVGGCHFYMFWQSKDIAYFLKNKTVQNWAQDPHWVYGFLQAASRQIHNQNSPELKLKLIETIMEPLSKTGLNLDKVWQEKFEYDKLGFNMAQEFEKYLIKKEQEKLNQIVLTQEPLIKKKQKI